ncbi:MAG: OsmC family peroxiredoxin [Phycisphaerae bacterium]|nr:OsmC family peroxiredoxin [Phycisphaerae bacterium]
MITKRATAAWKGTLADGQGVLSAGPEMADRLFDRESRFGQGRGVNPEELIGAALAGCFCMALAHAIEEEGYEPDGVEAVAEIMLEESAPEIAGIRLKTTGSIPGLSQQEFERLAEQTAQSCVVARALSAIEVTVEPAMLTPTGG